MPRLLLVHSEQLVAWAGNAGTKDQTLCKQTSGKSGPNTDLSVDKGVDNNPTCPQNSVGQSLTVHSTRQPVLQWVCAALRARPQCKPQSKPPVLTRLVCQ
jgi:hypothetical protein